MGRWRSLGRVIATVALVAMAQPVTAQQAPTGVILTIDQERLYAESAFGKAVIAREAAAARALEAENATIEASLVAEEQELTNKRKTMTAVDFTALADAFDAKVVRIRAEQDTKARDLTRGRDADRKAFYRAAVPVLGDLLVERNAVAIIDKSALILSLSSIDVTDAAVAKVDAALGTGAVNGGADPAPDPAPESAPESGQLPLPVPAPSP